MSEKFNLEELVNHFLNDENLPDKIKREMRDCIVNQIEDSIKLRYRKELELEARRNVYRQGIKSKIKDAKEVLISAIALSFVVGLLVNQITEILSWCLGYTGDSIGIFRGIICVGILLFVFAIYKYLYIDVVDKFIEKGDTSG